MAQIEMMDVVEVPRKVAAGFWGRPWVEVAAEAENEHEGAKLRHVRRGSTGECPKNAAWLRNEQGRAFLYFQNW